MPELKTQDYYHHWLGIAPEEQPPSHYRLLGLRAFESDPNVISNAADRQMQHIKRFQNGPHRLATQRLMNELAAARLCLLKSDAKQEYDRQLRDLLPPVAAQPLPPPLAAKATESRPIADGPTFLAPAIRAYGHVPRAFLSQRTMKRRKNIDAIYIVLASMFGLVVLLVLVLANRPIAKTMTPESGHGGLFNRVLPSVVVIETGGEHFGSGVIINNLDLVLTNYHVIAGAANARIKSHSGQELKVVGYVAVDAERDLALLKCEPFRKPLAVTIASSPLQVGERVFAIGSPLGLKFSLTDGIVSALRTGEQVREELGETYDRLGYTLDMLWAQHTAALSHGNSGGPLFNARGELVGLNTWNRPDGQNLNFAIDASEIRKFLNDPNRRFSRNLNNLPNPRSEPTDEKKDAPKPDAYRRDDTPPTSQPKQQDEPPPPTQSKGPERPIAPQPVPKEVWLNSPFPSGRVYSPSIFEVDTDRFKNLDPKDKNLIVIRHPNNEVFAIASHDAGKLHGVSIGRHDNKKVMVYATYFKGKRHGLLETWDHDGNPVLFSQYTMGNLNGFTCFFSDNLLLLLEFQYDKLKWIRIAVGDQVTQEFANRGDADADSITRDLFTKFDAADHAIDANEVEFRKQVSKVWEQHKIDAAKKRTPEIRRQITERNKRLDAEAAAERERYLRDTIPGPSRPYTLPIIVK